MKTFNEYHDFVQKLKFYPPEIGLAYCTMKLAGEAGEVSEKVAKIYRDGGGDFNYEKRTAIAKELGDVLWYVAALANELGFRLEEIAIFNVAKLELRKSRNTLPGDGDDR